MTRPELDELKGRVDLVAVIRAGGVELKKNGKSLKGRCPFHPDDDTPSLTVNPAAQLWNCFGCEAGGDVFRFLQLQEELTFPQALERVQAMAGGPVESPPPAPPAPTEALPGPYTRGALLGRVADYYAQRLREHAEAQQYLASRGLDGKELWDAFSVGYADGSLLRTLPSSGEVRLALTQLGVVNADGKEHLRGCVVVPLTHPEEGVVGLYGRRIRPDAQVKHLYLPGPQRGVLNWQALKLSPSVVVAESVLDALSLWRAGVLEATCLFGANRFPADLETLLGRYGTKEVVLCLDADRAGREAQERLAGPLSARGIRVLAVTLPEGKDPNQLLCDAGPDALKARVRQRPTEVAAGPPALPAAPESTVQGVVLECGGIRYKLTLKPPLTRLKVNLRGVRGAQLYVDIVDLLSQRDRTRAQKQLASTFALSLRETEQHMALLLEAAEQWVEERQREAEHQAEAEAQDFEPMTELERTQALEFLRADHLAERILQDMAELGYVGEENAKLLGYLIGLSRKLHSPLSGVVRSQSGAGKSALTELVEELTPPDEVIHFSRLSPQALYWMPRNCLKHKLLILEERVGAEAADYSIRVLQSKQQLSQAAVIKDATGKLATKTFVVEGPIAYLETTTNLSLNHENATRCFEIALDESAEQTQRIQEAQRASRLPSRRDRHLHREAVRRRHHCAQKQLEPVLIFVPYVEQLTFPSRWLRTRRDHERFLCLLEAVAFLHQHQRERGQTEDGSPYILATLADYALTYRLAKDVLASTLHELSRDAHDLWLAIRAWTEEQPGPPPLFTRRLLRQVTSIEDHRLRATLEELVEMEYVQAVSGSKGRAFEYRLLVAREAEAPSALRELLTPEELARRWQSLRPA